MKSKFALTTLAAVAAMGMGLGQASAATFIADGFNYPDGLLVGNGGWVNHSGGAPNINVVSNEAVLTVNGSEDAHKIGSAVNNGTDTWYYAAKVTPQDLDLTQPGFDQEYFIHFMQDSTFNFVSRVYIANASFDATGLSYAFGLSASSGGLVSKTSDILFSAGEQLIVASYNPVSGEARLWLNPASEADPFISDTAGVPAGLALDSLALRQGSNFVGGIPTPSFQVNVNGVGMASTFDEAVAASMIPEPASLALLGLGGLAMFRRR